MDVKVVDYDSNKHYVDYEVTGLNPEQLEFLKINLDEELSIEGGVLKIRMHFDENLFPFNSEIAKFKSEDFIAREEIEMNVFLSSILDDMK